MNTKFVFSNNFYMRLGMYKIYKSSSPSFQLFEVDRPCVLDLHSSRSQNEKLIKWIDNLLSIFQTVIPAINAYRYDSWIFQ